VIGNRGNEEELRAGAEKRRGHFIRESPNVKGRTKGKSTGGLK